jgi:ribosome-associated protein
MRSVNNRQYCVINSSVTIPLSEISFSYSRSSGKGGQHVNKVNSRVSLYFDIKASKSLTAEQKKLLCQQLAVRINSRGVLRLDADRRRSQIANREDILHRFAELLRTGLQVKKNRRKTKPSKGAARKRLQAKKQRSQLKKQRGKRDYNE